MKNFGDEHLLISSINDMHLLAKRFSDIAKGGTVFALHGDLGSGKTTFTQGFGKALGIKQPITSPTFLLMKEYPVPSRVGITKLFHVDLYRITHDDTQAIGLRDVLSDSDAVTIIEWPEKAMNLLPTDTHHLYFTFVDESTRQVVVKGVA